MVFFVICLPLACGKGKDGNIQWWNDAWHYRVNIEVNPGEAARRDSPVETRLDLDALLARLGESAAPDTTTVRLVETDSSGAVRDQNVPLQYEPDGTLIFLLTGDSRPGQTRRYSLYFDTEEHSSARAASDTEIKVSAHDSVLWQGQQSIMVATESATWYYHKAGAGFASLVDSEGNDWLSYRPCCESGGEYRGIPNMWHFHPGKDSCSSRIESTGPLRTHIRSAALDNSLECVWDIYPDHARMTLLRADTTYWFLYEGTPGGSLQVSRDFNVISNGVRRSIEEDWQGDLPDPEWVFFGDDSVGRVLYVVNHHDDSYSDQFWQMREEMVVFGFGREYRCCGTYMDRVPAEFTVGLAEDTAFAKVSSTIEGAWRPAAVRIGEPERLR